MVTENRGPWRLQAAGDEWVTGGSQQPRVLRGVDRRPVVERISIRVGLDAVVATGPADRVDAPTAKDREGVGQLVVLIVVDQVAALDHEVRA